jgi:hypothetical protein
LTRETVVRAQTTWLGSTTSPGGTSPVLHLPVGEYSVGPVKPYQATADPEPAVFVLGETPHGLIPQPSDADLEAIVATAEATLLADFTSAERPVLRAKPDIESALASAYDGATVSIFAVADTTGGGIRLPDGNLLTPESLSGMVDGFGEDSKVLIMVEGPQSGAFAREVLFRTGTTIITSCAAQEENNRMSPAHGSFSARFLEKCRLGRSVAQSFNAAEVYFLNPFYGQLQNPDFIEGELGSIQLRGRFISAELPDLVPPEVVAISPTDLVDAVLPLELAVMVSDNRDSRNALTVEAELLSSSGAILEQIGFLPPETTDGSHIAILPEAPLQGFGLRITATDQSGNHSLPISIWVSDSTRTMAYDIDSSGRIDRLDLVELLRMRKTDSVTGHWLFEFAQDWMGSGND